MKKYIYLILALAFYACQDKDFDREEMKLAAIDENAIEAELQGDDLVWSWTGNSDLDMQVVIYANDTKFILNYQLLNISKYKFYFVSFG